MKEVVNERFIECINYLLDEGEESSKAKISEKLSLKPSMFSEILKKRVNVSVEHIFLLCKNWSFFNADWVITGYGSKIKSRNELLEKTNWIIINDFTRFKSEQFDEEALLRVGYRIFIVCETYNLQMHELGKIVNDQNIPQYIAGILPVPEQTLDSILRAFPDISEKWLYTSFGSLKKENTELLLKELIETQKRLIDYKDAEITGLKKDINELKKEEKSPIHIGKVAETGEKLSKKH